MAAAREFHMRAWALHVIEGTAQHTHRRGWVGVRYLRDAAATPGVGVLRCCYSPMCCVELSVSVRVSSSTLLGRWHGRRGSEHTVLLMLVADVGDD